jgi:hypothetical protein
MLTAGEGHGGTCARPSIKGTNPELVEAGWGQAGHPLPGISQVCLPWDLDGGHRAAVDENPIIAVAIDQYEGVGGDSVG